MTRIKCSAEQKDTYKTISDLSMDSIHILSRFNITYSYITSYQKDNILNVIYDIECCSDVMMQLQIYSTFTLEIINVKP